MFIDEDKCIGCESCINWCPMGAISMGEEKAVIDQAGVCGVQCMPEGRDLSRGRLCATPPGMAPQREGHLQRSAERS